MTTSHAVSVPATAVDSPPLPLPVLIDLLAERVEVAKAHESVAPVGCLGELLDQAIPHLRRLQDIEARRA